MKHPESKHGADTTSAMQQAIADLDQIIENQKTLIDIYVETTHLLQAMMESQRQVLDRLTE